MRYCPICMRLVPETKRTDCRFDKDECRNEFKALAKRAKRQGWSTEDYLFATKHLRAPLTEIISKRVPGSIGYVCVLYRSDDMPLINISDEQITFPEVPIHYRVKFGSGRSKHSHFTLDPIELPRVPFDFLYQIRYVAPPSVVMQNHPGFWLEIPGTPMTFGGNSHKSEPDIYGRLCNRNG